MIEKLKVGINPEKQPHLLVSIFINSIIGNPNIYPVPTKRNVLQLPDKSEISIDTNAYGAFFQDMKENIHYLSKIILNQ